MHSDGEVSDSLLPVDCIGICVRVCVGSRPPGCLGYALAANSRGARNTNPRDGEVPPHRLGSPPRCRLLAGCAAYTQRCRYAAWLWPPLRDPDEMPTSEQRPLRLSLHSAQARFSRLRAV